MPGRLSCSALVAACWLWPAAWSQGSGGKVPSGVILVRGAWSSSSDTETPLPEGGSVANHVFSDQYFGVTYPLPAGWSERYKGPPPSDTGRYVLAQLGGEDAATGHAPGSMLITAQDMFFAPSPVNDAAGLIHYMKDNLQPDYKVDTPPTQTRIGDHLFTLFAYWSPVAQLHWYTLATEVRCHTLQIVITSRDTELLEGLVRGMNQMKFSAAVSATEGPAGSSVPVCIKDYARNENVIERIDPVFTEHRFNRVPVRIIIDKEGKVKHIHFLSTFSDQAKAISEALGRWRFKPYLRQGEPVEVETGILFGR